MLNRIVKLLFMIVLGVGGFELPASVSNRLALSDFYALLSVSP